MIDLSKKGLPNTIIDGDGNPILLNTDYRLWIRFNQDLNSPEDVDISYLFNDQENVPIIDDFILYQLKMFLYNPNPTPKASSNDNNVKTLDYILDGEYIYSALYSTYGIDIIDMDLHWHKFLALCNNVIGESTLWGYAKAIRSYQKPPKKFDYDKEKMKDKEAWAFPIELTEEEQKKKDEFDDYFS